MKKYNIKKYNIIIIILTAVLLCVARYHLIVSNSMIKAFSNNVMEGKRLNVNFFSTDKIKVNKFRDFIRELSYYKVSLIKTEIGDRSNMKNIIITHDFIKSLPNKDYIKSKIEEGATVVIETSHAPYVLINELGFKWDEVESGNYFPGDTEIMAFAVHKNKNKYSIGYAKINKQLKLSEEYYNTLLQGFIRE